MADFILTRAVSQPLLRGLFGAGVIGMHERRVARKPLECFVNGQLCLSASEPISHSKVWHHAKLPPNHSCVVSFKKKKKKGASAHICEYEIHCFCALLFSLISSLADGHFSS